MGFVEGADRAGAPHLRHHHGAGERSSEAARERTRLVLPADGIEAVPAGPAVNKVVNDGPECAQPTAA